MNQRVEIEPGNARRRLRLAARWAVGGLFLYLGLQKAAEPVEFLKLLREYGVLTHPLMLTGVAVMLPWFEAFCGLMVVLGIAVRGSALLLSGLLAGFSLVLLQRALGLQDTLALPFCAVSFNCGCGLGTVGICGKLAENAFLLLLSTGLLLSHAPMPRRAKLRPVHVRPVPCRT